MEERDKSDDGLPACMEKERKTEMQNLTLSNSAFLSFSMQAGRPASSNMLVGIFNMLATSGLQAALECTKMTKFVFGQGSTRDPAGGAYSAPPDPLAGLRGTYF